jgi:hypothetical protein
MCMEESPLNFRIRHLTTPAGAWRKAPTIGCSAISLLAFGISAQASILVINGGFESTTNGAGQFDFSTQATGWTSDGYNFIFASGTGDTTGSNGQFGNLSLWGLANGGADFLPASSPNGGNFVAADGAFDTGAISQTIDGLTAGDSYTVGFWWAGAQQFSFTGPTTEQWQVSLGGETQSTAVVDNASHGLTGWEYQTMNFTADNTSDLLSFLAVGTPDGVPPFVLLDGVSLNANATTPEPGTLLLMLGGLLGGLGVIRLKRRVKS